jgi:hypothetical protein
LTIENLEVSLSLVEKSVQEAHEEDDLVAHDMCSTSQTFNKQEFYNVAFSVDVGDAQLAMLSVNNKYAGLPEQALGKELFPLHNRGIASDDKTPVLLVLGCRRYATLQEQRAIPRTARGAFCRLMCHIRVASFWLLIVVRNTMLDCCWQCVYHRQISGT